MKVSVVIPATDAPLTLPRCIAAIRASSDPPQELIVIDAPRAAGPSEARNIGASRASGDVLIFIDADVEIHADALARIRAAFVDDPELNAIFGSYDDDPAADGVVSDFRNLLHHHVHQQGAGVATTFWAGLGAIRRETFFTAGGFDSERFPDSSVEDIELGMRLVALDARIVLDPRIQGKHLKHWTLRSMARTDLVRRGVPWVRLLLEQGSPSTTLNLGWRHRLSALTSLGLAGTLAVGRPRLSAPLLVLLLAVNHRFYSLVLRKRGPATAFAAIPIHIVHDLVSIAAVPLAVASHWLNEDKRKDPPAS